MIQKVDIADIIDIIERAANRVQRNGWTQGDNITPDGRVCAVGGLKYEIFDGNADAVRDDGDGESSQWDLFDKAIEAIAQANAVVVGCDDPTDLWVDAEIIEYNDADDRTQADIDRLFRHTIEVLRAEGDAS